MSKAEDRNMLRAALLGVEPIRHDGDRRRLMLSERNVIAEALLPILARVRAQALRDCAQEMREQHETLPGYYIDPFIWMEGAARQHERDSVGLCDELVVSLTGDAWLCTLPRRHEGEHAFEEGALS